MKTTSKTAVKATSCDLGSDTHDGDARAVGGTVTAQNDGTLTEIQAVLYARFGVIVEPIVSTPPVDAYEPNPFVRRHRDNALRHQAEDIRRWKKIGGTAFSLTSQTDSDGENDI